MHRRVETTTSWSSAFHGLLDDYSRWVDRLDQSDRNPLQGGLLDLDGSGSTAASAAWMACYSVWMLSLAVELARDDLTYQDVAVTFLDTTLAMVSALDDMGGSGIGMWDENDGWYHDVARASDGEIARLAGRSVIGLVPLLAVAVIPARHSGVCRRSPSGWAGRCVMTWTWRVPWSGRPATTARAVTCWSRSCRRIAGCAC